ncbi:MAG: hypothetical protein EXS18_02075 [Verrucomicrobiae bacterium]|nr:hypothetical protein [Verrucomicrobiae bacterium]
MITFCPKCGTKLAADESFIGKQVQCGKCSNRFTVIPADLPSASAETEETFPEAPPPPSPMTPIGGEMQPIGAEESESEQAEEPSAEGSAAPPPVAPSPPGARPKPTMKKSETAVEGGSKCPKCNADLLPNAVLCTRCGTFLKEPEAAAKKKSLMMPIMIVVTVLCMGGAGGWVWWNSRKQSEEETPRSPLPVNAQTSTVASGATPSPTPKAYTPGKVDLTPLSPKDIEAVSKLPAEDPALTAEESAEVANRNPLVPQPTLLQTVLLKGPLRDRHQSDKPPQLAPNTRVITLRLHLRQTDTDPPITLSADTLKVTTDAGPGVLYGVEFTNILASTTWLPRGAAGDSSSIIETARCATRRVADLNTEKLASDDLLTRPAYATWFERVAGPIPGDKVMVVSALNQVLGANNRVESESGIFLALQPLVYVHLLVPTSAGLVRLQYTDRHPIAFPIDVLATIPTTSQPDPVPFINATLDKARVLLASTASEDAIAGAELLVEAGNLDMLHKLKPTAYKGWANDVTQLLTRAEADCRVAAVDAIMRSQHVDPKLRGELFMTVVKDSTPSVRRRAAELLADKPGLLDKAYKEGMGGLEALLVDSNFTVRAAANVSNCRLAVQGDDNLFESQIEFIQKGLMDPVPSVRLALLASILPMQDTDARPAVSKLARLLKHVRLNLFDSSETVRALAAKTIVGLRSPVGTSIVSDALQQIPDKVATLFAQAALELPIGSANDMTNRVPVLADKQVQTLLLPTLAKCLDDARPATRQAAARVIGAFQPEVADVVLAAAATNNDLGVRLIVFSSLNSPDRTVVPPVSVFADGLNDPDQRIRGAAFSMFDQTLLDPVVLANVVSNIAARTVSATIRALVAQKCGAIAVSNAPVLFAMSSFLTDKDDSVWRAAITPWARTRTQFTWKEIEPVWTLLIKQPTTARRLGAFYPLYLAVGETVIKGTNAIPIPTHEAVEEAAKLLGDPDATLRDSALVFIAPHRRGADTEAMRNILTDPKVEFSTAVRNQLLVALARPSTAETLEVVDRIRPATEDDKKKERDALNAAATAITSQPASAPNAPAMQPPMRVPPGPAGPGFPPMPPGMRFPPGAQAPPAPPATPLPPKPQPTTAPGRGPQHLEFEPINYRDMKPVTSRTGIYLLTQWAMSQNPSASVAASYLTQLVQPMYGRAWLMPSERASVVQGLRRLSEVPAAAASAKITLSKFEDRFPFGVAAKSLASDQTQGAAESADTLATFMAPKKKPMIIATYKAPSGNLIDIWLNAEESVPPTYPPDAPKDSGPVWKQVSKLEGSRVEPLDKETLARLEWAIANAPKEKVREALLKIARTEGDVGPISRTVAFEGLLLLASQGDADAEAEAVKMGWLKM